MTKPREKTRGESAQNREKQKPARSRRGTVPVKGGDQLPAT